MNTWFIVVLFAMTSADYADGGRDMYVFTEPTYSEQSSCMADIVDPVVIPTLVQKLLSEYGPREIESVVCANEQQLQVLMNGLQAT